MLWMLVRLPLLDCGGPACIVFPRVKMCWAAGATRIDVRLEGGGLKSVEVRGSATVVAEVNVSC